MGNAKHRRPSAIRAAIFTLHFVFQTHVHRRTGNCISSAADWLKQVPLCKVLIHLESSKTGVHAIGKALAGGLGSTGLPVKPVLSLQMRVNGSLIGLLL